MWRTLKAWCYTPNGARNRLSHIRQEVDTPSVQLNADRIKANEAGLTQHDVSNSMLIALSSSGHNPQSRVSYQVYVQTPRYRVDSFDSLAVRR